MRRLIVPLLAALGLLAVLGTAAWAEGAGTTAAPPFPTVSKIDPGDTAWVLTSAALVMLMTPGLAFFYGGLVRKKNVLSVLMQCMIILCLISIQWVVFGYSLAFGPDFKGIIGDLSWLGLSGVGMDPSPAYAQTTPHMAFMIFQAMFAVITPALIIGAFAERMRFGPFCIFALLWATLVYDPVAHWVWGNGGFLREMGTLDFAGGTVVHINAGLSALAAALFLGKRRGFPDKTSPPHSLPFAALGAGLLWFGWFGFNAGSALRANGVAASAFVATHVAGAAAGLAWSLLDWGFYKKPTCLGMITGAVAGLAAVTPAAGFVGPMGAIAIGVGSGIFCWLSVTFIKTRFGYDDSLDAFGVHGVGGIWGTLATGIWAVASVGGTDGLLAGNPIQFWIQAKTVVVICVYGFIVTLVLLKVVNAFARLRATEMEERVGLDLTQHREASYTLID